MHYKKSRVSEFLSHHFPFDKMNQYHDYEHVIIPEWRCEEPNVIVTLIGSYLPFLAILHQPFVDISFPLPASWPLDLALKCLALDEITPKR
jgi:hypothetical protein